MGRFDGAWEENSVKGPRVEIEGNKLTRLWMSAPVLETMFTTYEENGKIVFKLEHDGLRNAGSLDPYAVIKECYFDGTALVLVDDYRFSGVSETKLYPSTHSRYGNVNLVNEEMLPILKGRWESKYYDLVFEGSTLNICGHEQGQHNYTVEIVTARTIGCDNGDVKILNKDPAVQEIESFCSLVYNGETITGCIPVCDDSPIIVTFTKKG